ncbi:MAG: hypothetical protein NC253_01470 [Ruminococcus sp.]|nr:hypothetical protein [Ruminococcus sp.]
MFTQILKEVQGTKQDIKDINKRLDKIEDDLDVIKEKCDICYNAANHNGEVLEQMVKDLAPLNMISVKY